MYPSAELNILERRKAVLRTRISLNRLRCTALATEAMRPLDWLDRVVVLWRKISPLAKMAALPLGLLLQRKALPGKKAGLFRWGMQLLPTVLTAVRMYRAHAAERR